MTTDKLSNSIRQAFELLRARPRYAPFSLRAVAVTHEDPDPDWQPL